jgi:hypothetical protein
LESRQDRFGGDLAIGDMDGDGFKDIVVPESSNSGRSGAVSWFRNPGSLGGKWTEVVVSTWSGSGTGNMTEHMSDIAVGDIDGDGRQDIVVRDVSHGLWVLIQISGGTDWHTRRFIPTNPREGLALWDPDEDGDLDILLNGVWLETPSDPVNGDYLPRAILGAEGWYPDSITTDSIRDYACQVEAGDFNNDGRVDFVISNSEELNNASSTDSKPSGIRVYLSPNDPVNDAWREVVLHPDHFSWHSCEVGDIDGDGDLDVISGISTVGTDDAPQLIMAFLNEGDGTAFAQDTISTEYAYNSSIGDADGDGDLDLFAPESWNRGPIRYFQNTTGPVTPPNSPPEVAILEPEDESAFIEGSSIQFSGMAGDAEDGDLSGSIQWSSDLDGALGAGAVREFRS